MTSRPMPATVALLALCTALAGCGAQAPAGGPALTVEGSACSGPAAHACASVDGVLVVSGLDLVGDGAARTGIKVAATTVPVILRSITLQGYPVAIEVASACAACRVQLEDVRILADQMGVLAGSEGPVEGGLAIRRSLFTAGRVGHSVDLGAGTVGQDTLAIVTRDVPGGLELESIAFSATGPSYGRAVWAQEGGTLQASDVTVAGYGRAFVGDWSHVALARVDVACVHDALWAPAAYTAVLHNLTVRGCMDGLGCAEDCPPAVFLTHAQEVAGSSVEAEGLVMARNPRALDLGSYATVRLDRFDISDGSRGLSVAYAERLEMGGGRITNQSAQGAVVGAGFLDIQGVEFLGNGHDPQGPGNPVGLDVRVPDSLLDAPPVRTIRDSSFVGNVRFGLIAPVEGQVDARLNWWGSPLGPSPPTPAAAGNTPAPGFGDMAVGALTHPHLTAPPS